MIFSHAGIRIDWRGSSCPERAIHVEIAEGSPALERPGALAYALPYQGTRIVVFLDRLRNIAAPSTVPSLLGHVIAHEVTHLLQGVVRHSCSGVMKAAWNADDYRQMRWGVPLSFTKEDLLLIQLGMQAKPFLTSTD
jgi:hypothetical protein